MFVEIRSAAECGDVATTELTPVDEDRRQNLADLSGPQPQQAMAGPAIEGLPDALAERRLQRGRIVRRRKQEAAMGRQAGGQAKVVHSSGFIFSRRR